MAQDTVLQYKLEVYAYGKQTSGNDHPDNLVERLANLRAFNSAWARLALKPQHTVSIHFNVFFTISQGVFACLYADFNGFKL